MSPYFFVWLLTDIQVAALRRIFARRATHIEWVVEKSLIEVRLTIRGVAYKGTVHNNQWRNGCDLDLVQVALDQLEDNIHAGTNSFYTPAEVMKAGHAVTSLLRKRTAAIGGTVGFPQ